MYLYYLFILFIKGALFMNEKEKKEKEQLERMKSRIKRQNENAKNNWDCVSLKLPKGTKERIVASGATVNGLINKLVLEYLDSVENDIPF